MIPLTHNDQKPILQWISHQLKSLLKLILSDRNSRSLFLFLILNLSFAFVELIYGIWSNSLGLISDAFHMFFDCTGLLAGLAASVITKWKANDKYSYGYVRAEVLAGFVNGLFLVFIAFFILSEAVERAIEPPDVKHERLLVVSVMGLFVNLIGIYAFQHAHSHGGSHGHSHNNHGEHQHSHSGQSQIMKGVLLHIMADTLGSVGVIVSSLLMQFFGWMRADPICSIFIALLILVSVMGLIKESVMILMQRQPVSLDNALPQCYQKVMQLPGVYTIQEPNFWTLCSDNYVGALKLEVSKAADPKYIPSQMLSRLQRLSSKSVHLIGCLSCSSISSISVTSNWESLMELHQKCRNTTYGNTGNVQRLHVPDDKVKWDQKWEEYDPPYFTAEGIIGKPWADPEIGEGFTPAWNSLDEKYKVDRKSHTGTYDVVDGYPLNVAGRTGLRGRGILGKWGPNHAADPIVTRWKRDADGRVVQHPVTNKPVLQFVSIRRKDNKQWAFPGGMVDPGEVISQTLKREFLEETMNSLEMSESAKTSAEHHLEDFFAKGEDIYKGYVDDPRNTDNAWMETVAKNFHDEDGSFVGTLNLNAGDDAVGVCWMDVSQDLQLYASHSSMLQRVVETFNAHW